MTGYLYPFLTKMKFSENKRINKTDKAKSDSGTNPKSAKADWFNESKQYNNFPLPSFSKSAGTCQICGNKYRARSWDCGIREDGIMAVCVNVWSEKTDKDGRYIHILKNDAFIKAITKPITAKHTELAQKANPEKLDKVYQIFLEQLKLKPFHADKLLDYRLLSDATIALNLYASIPENKDFEKALTAVLFEVSDLSECAGFYADEVGNWKITYCPDGFFVPCRNIKGQIVALQIRLDDPKDNKFIWFSSGNKEKGSSPIIPLHYAKPDLIKQTSKLVITGGLLKADICAERLECAVAGIAGAGVSIERAREYINELKTEFPMIQQVSLAPDADWRERKGVRTAFMNLQIALTESEIETKVLQWKKELGKGLDDVFNTKLINEEGY